MVTRVRGWGWLVKIFHSLIHYRATLGRAGAINIIEEGRVVWSLLDVIEQDIGATSGNILHGAFLLLSHQENIASLLILSLLSLLLAIFLSLDLDPCRESERRLGSASPLSTLAGRFVVSTEVEDAVLPTAEEVVGMAS